MRFLNPFVLLYQGTLFTTTLLTWWKGRRVGTDAFGNRYYEGKRKQGKNPKRWVVYKGIVEPSKVPPEWHGWLHYTSDSTPLERGIKTHVWQKKGQPNLSGTVRAYAPSGGSDGNLGRTVISSYEAWNPNG